MDLQKSFPGEVRWGPFEFAEKTGNLLEDLFYGHSQRMLMNTQKAYCSGCQRLTLSGWTALGVSAIRDGAGWASGTSRLLVETFNEIMKTRGLDRIPPEARPVPCLMMGTRPSELRQLCHRKKKSFCMNSYPAWGDIHVPRFH